MLTTSLHPPFFIKILFLVDDFVVKIHKFLYIEIICSTSFHFFIFEARLWIQITLRFWHGFL